MDSSSRKKIVRKVFYSTGSAVGAVAKLKDGVVDIAKSFNAGYHLLGNDPIPNAPNDQARGVKPSGQQMEGLYGYFGRIIFDHSRSKDISFVFNPGSESLQEKAEDLLKELSPSSERTAPPSIAADPRSEDDLGRLKSVVNLSRVNTPQARAELLSHAKDPDSLVRRVIVNCINPEGGEDETFAIVKFINDPDEDVARIAIRKSAKTRNRLAFTYLIARLDSENMKIRQEAIDALKAITGSDLGFNPQGASNHRHEVIRLWQKVWQDNQMNSQFLIDDEATQGIIKRKYTEKPHSPEPEAAKTTKKHKEKHGL